MGLVKGRVAAKSDADSLSSLNTSRLTLDRSPRSLNSKPATPNSALQRTTKKPQARGATVKGLELQARLNALQEDLSKAKEQISVIEKKKEQAVIELKNDQKVVDEANGKLQEALVAQKRAEFKVANSRSRVNLPGWVNCICHYNQ
ncbi:Putative WEB family protein At1g65010, chloroplastic [Linum perenne]